MDGATNKTAAAPDARFSSARPTTPTYLRRAPDGSGINGAAPGPYDCSTGVAGRPGSAVYDTHLLPPFATGVNPYGEFTLPIFERVSFRLCLVGSENLVAAQHASSDVVGHVAVELPDPGVVGDHVGHYHAGG